MSKCRRKPEEFDVWQWTSPMSCDEATPDWVTEALARYPRSNGLKFGGNDKGANFPYLLVNNQFTEVAIRVEDYVLRNSKGNISACSAKEFDENFEFVEEKETWFGIEELG